MTARDDFDTTPDEVLDEITNTPRQRAARASSFHCDGNLARLLTTLPKQAYDLAFVQTPRNELIASWWKEAEQRLWLDEHRSQVPLLPQLIELYPRMRSRLTLFASVLLECRRTVRRTGAVVFQCDPTEEHFVRLLMDAVYGEGNFLNSIAWDRGLDAATTITTRFVTSRDSLVAYRLSDDTPFRPLLRPANLAYAQNFNLVDSNGRRYRRQSLTAKTWGSSTPWKGRRKDGREFYYDPFPRKWAPPRKMTPENLHGNSLAMLDFMNDEGNVFHSDRGMPDYPQYAGETIDKGNPVSDIWEYHAGTEGTLYNSDEAIDQDVENLGGVLSRFTRALAGEGSSILLPFCEDETVIEAACSLNCLWTALGANRHTLKRVRHALSTMGVCSFTVYRNPTTFEEALDLRDHDPSRLECQRVSLDYLGRNLGAKPVVRTKGGSDKGKDGEFNLFDEGHQRRKIVCSIKSGKDRDSGAVRDLNGVRQREGADIGVLLTWVKPTKPMLKEADEVNNHFKGYPRIQIKTMEGIMNGSETVEYPASWRP